MMTSRPIHPAVSIFPGSPGHTLLRRVLGIQSSHSSIERMTLIDDAPWRIIFRDTGPDGTSTQTPASDVAIHLLWAMNDDHAHLVIDGRTIPIAPGDMITIPSATSWSAASGMILCEISSPANTGERAGDRLVLSSPTHGEERFHGYNRQTTYPSPPGLAIERWKITQPLTLPDAEAPYAVIDLTDPLAMVWRGGTDLIGRGECRIILPGIGPVTLLPNGLGYALIIRQPYPRT